MTKSARTVPRPWPGRQAFGPRLEPVARLGQDYRAQVQGADMLQRVRLKAGLKYRKLNLEREYRENIKKARRPLCGAPLCSVLVERKAR